jgi:hypothetical protein
VKPAAEPQPLVEQPQREQPRIPGELFLDRLDDHRRKARKFE